MHVLKVHYKQSKADIKQNRTVMQSAKASILSFFIYSR